MMIRKERCLDCLAQVKKTIIIFLFHNNLFLLYTVNVYVSTL